MHNQSKKLKDLAKRYDTKQSETTKLLEDLNEAIESKERSEKLVINLKQQQ